MHRAGLRDEKLIRWEKRVERESAESVGEGLRLLTEECFYYGGLYCEGKNISNTMSHLRDFQTKGTGLDTVRFTFLKDNADPQLLQLEMR